LGNTPLHYAALKNHAEIARFLLGNGADINRKNDYGDTPLEWMEGCSDFEEIISETKASAVWSNQQQPESAPPVKMD
jgi:ankyrin repeat protein